MGTKIPTQAPEIYRINEWGYHFMRREERDKRLETDVAQKKYFGEPIIVQFSQASADIYAQREKETESALGREKVHVVGSPLRKTGTYDTGSFVQELKDIGRALIGRRREE